MPLELRRLEQLIAVAAEGSITRAAQQLHLSQQALSTSMQNLEREVGVALLDRSGTAVTPTPAGQSLIDDAHMLRGATHAALLRTRRIGRGESETLRIGHTPAVTGEEVSTLLRHAGTADPDLATLVNQRYPAELRTELTAGQLDIGLCRAMTPPRGLARTLLGQHRLNLAVSAGHHLAERDTVRLTELADEHILVWGQPGRSGYTDLLIQHCRQAGFEPHIERTTLQGTPPVTAVIDSDYVAFVTAPPGLAVGGQVRVVELQPPTFVPLHALWQRNTSSESRDTFLAAAATD